MDWPDAAHGAFSGLPLEHRVASLYILLAGGGIVVLMIVRKLLAGLAVPPPPPSAGPPVNVQMIPWDQAIAAVRAELRAQINGSLARLERAGEQRAEKIDRLDEKLDGHGERLIRLEERLMHIDERGRWDGRDRRQR